jgi:hypothetical protein
MSCRSFKNILHVLTPYLQVNAKQVPVKIGIRVYFPIDGCFIIVCYVIWMVGLIMTFEFSRCCIVSVHLGINAILKCQHIKIQFPTDDAWLKEVVMEFQNKSSFGVLDGCVGALDGWLHWINTQFGRDTSKISAFLLAITSIKGLMWFVILGVDLHIYHAIAPEELVIVGLSMELHCSTYTLLSSLLFLYTGSDKKVEENDVFHFFCLNLGLK